MKGRQRTMTEVAIRPYDSADLEQCRALWAELVQHHRDLYADPSVGGQSPGLYFDRHLARVGSDRIWVATCAGRVLGFAALILNGEEAEVEPIVVALGERGKGIGRTLLKHVVEEASRLGVRYLSVRPVARNVRAMSFFYHCGFRLLGRVELFMELPPSAHRTWKPGPDLFGLSFEH